MLIGKSEDEAFVVLQATQMSDRLARTVAQHVDAVSAALRALHNEPADADVAQEFTPRVEECLTTMVRRPQEQRERLQQLLLDLAGSGGAAGGGGGSGGGSSRGNSDGPNGELGRRAANGAQPHVAVAVAAAAAPTNSATSASGNGKPRLSALFSHRDSAFHGVQQSLRHHHSLATLLDSLLLEPCVVPAAKLSPSLHPRVRDDCMATLRKEHEQRAHERAGAQRRLAADRARLATCTGPLEAERAQLLLRVAEIDEALAAHAAERAELDDRAAELAKAEADADGAFEKTMAGAAKQVRTSWHTAKVRGFVGGWRPAEVVV
jgi:hypothetical protein